MEDKNVAIFRNTTIIKTFTIILMSICCSFFSYKELNVILLIPLFSFCFYSGINYFLLGLSCMVIGNFINYNEFFFYILIGISAYILLYFILNIFKIKAKILHFFCSVFAVFITYLVFFILDKKIILLDLALVLVLSSIISFLFSIIIDIFINPNIYFKSENHLLISVILLALYLAFCPYKVLAFIMIGFFTTILAIKTKILYLLSSICCLYIFLIIFKNNLFNELIYLLVPTIFLSFFKDSNKYGYFLIYLISSFLLSFLLERNLISYLASNGICSLLILLTPSTFFTKLSEENHGYEIYLAHKKELYKQLDQFSNLFSAIGKLFANSKKSRILAKANVEVFDKLCSNCQKNFQCHQNKNNLLLNYFKDGITGKLTATKKQYISENCLKADAYFILIEKFLNTYLLKHYESDEICQIKGIVSEQFSGFSKIINLYKDNILKDRLLIAANFYHDIKIGLQEYSFDVLYVNNYSSKNLFKFDIAVAKIKQSDINYLLIPIINNILGVSMKVDNITQTTLLSNYIILSISEISNNNIEFAYKQNSKDTLICGDYINYIDENQKLYFAISDGMGNGLEANEESVFTLNVLFNTIHSKMDISEGIKITNSLLKLRNDYDTYTTLDLVFIDKANLTAKFYKAGATYSFIIRNNEINVIENYSYPLGIIDEVEIEPYFIKLYPNDIILMLSDGVIDEFNEEIKEVILSCQEDNIKVLLRELFEKLISIKENRDDASLAIIQIK